MSTPSIDRLKAYGKSQVGTTEHPPNSNHVIYWDTYHDLTGAPAYEGQPWCGCYGICLHRHVGVFTPPANWISVTAIQSWGEEQGRWHRGSDGIMAGDQLVIAGPGVHTETAMSAAAADGSVKVSNGGNTSPRAGSGDQFNGGCVAWKTRQASEIYGYVRLHDLYAGTGSTTKSKAAKKPAQPQYVKAPANGALKLWQSGPRVTRLQTAIGMHADGYYGRSTAAAIAKRKKQLHLVDRNGDVARVEFLQQVETSPAKRVAKPPTLHQGDKGGSVQRLQRGLHAKGYLTAKQVDGDYGPHTAAAVHQLKVNHHLRRPSGTTAGRRVWHFLERGTK